MKFETLELVKQDKIATITFNRPELLNAVNEQFIWDFQKATSDVKEDDSIKVLIINASGRGFCAGADLSERKSTWEGSQDALMRGFKPFFENILSMPKPVIAAVQGPAAGIGASIAMSCDLRVMSENGYILSVFSNIALVCPMEDYHGSYQDLWDIQRHMNTLSRQRKYGLMSVCILEWLIKLCLKKS